MDFKLFKNVLEHFFFQSEDTTVHDLFAVSLSDFLEVYERRAILNRILNITISLHILFSCAGKIFCITTNFGFV